MELVKKIRGLFGTTDMADQIDIDRALIQEVRTNAELSSNPPEAPELENFRTRRIMFKIWQAYVDNTVYMPSTEGGYRKLINAYLGSGAVGNISGIFNPIERAVRAYELVFDGSFGDEIDVDPTIDKSTKVNDLIIDPIHSIWKWSNINSWKTTFCTKAASLGSVGLRITFKNAKRIEDRRIVLTPEHPGQIRELEVDERGNITQIVLEYSKMEGEFFNADNPREKHDYLEFMGKDKFWMQRDGLWWNFITRQNVKSREEAEVPNVLGFVPYELAKCGDIGSDWGVPCFYGNERKIDNLNAIAAHIINQIKRHVTATWLLEGSGPPPEPFVMGDMNVWYVQKETGVNSSASMTPLVAKMNLNDAITQQEKLQAEISNSMPELKATDGAFLSHQSGGTVSQLRLPAESRIISTRNNIEHALVRAHKKALSIGIIYDMWDIGNGMGSRKIADAAFDAGDMDHRFNKRPALPRTVSDELEVAKTQQALAAAKNPNVPKVFGGDNTGVPEPGKPEPQDSESGASNA